MDIIGSLIYLILIVIFLGAIAVISFVSYDYFNYKNDNTLKLNNVINSTDNNKKEIIDITTNTSNLDVTLQSLNKDIINKNLLIDTIDTTVKLNTSNIKTFDTGLKNFFTFSNDTSNINTGLFEYYMFGAGTTKSLDLISKTTAVAGMTINTKDDATSFEICDADNKLNCIKMKNSGKNFVISPSNENTSNILFQNKTNQTVLNVDLINNTTYFNGNDNTSVMYVNNEGLHMNKPIYTSSINLYDTDITNTCNLSYANYSNLLARNIQ
jgi:hypothetical protein